MTGYRAEIGDLVDAEYVANIRGDAGMLRGIVVGVGEWQGAPTHSVYALGESTSSNSLPVHPVAPRDSQEARDALAEILPRLTSNTRLLGRVVTLPANWEDMGASARDLWIERRARSLRKGF